MSKNYIIDYLACILFRLFGPFVRSLPIKVSFFLGRVLGELLYYFDYKHRSVVYANIKTAFGFRLSCLEIKRITRNFYRTFGQNFIEIFLIPVINKEYVARYIHIEGLKHIEEGFKRGKGIIFLGIHEGSWELSNTIAAHLNFSFNLFVRELRYPRLNALLNHYRSKRGCKIIQREDQARQLIRILRSNESFGMTLDQGGKTGVAVTFFGKSASMSGGAIRLALKYDATVIPVFLARVSGPEIRMFVEPPVQLEKSGDIQKDLSRNLQKIISIYEKYLTVYPQEYLWSYKIWKYSHDRNILILSDAKTGHLRQAQSLGKIVAGYFQEKGFRTSIDTQEIGLKNAFAKYALSLSGCLSGKYTCQGCLSCLKKFLTQDTYRALISKKPDVIISCGSSLAAVNLILSGENRAKSLVIMRPSFYSLKRFDLVVLPYHDHPPKRENVVVTKGALNLVEEKYLQEESGKLRQFSGFKPETQGLSIGVFLGGNTKKFVLKEQDVSEVLRQLKDISARLDLDILITTSRRTSIGIEALVKKELGGYPGCKLMIISNEKNIPFAVGGILGLSQIVVVSAESISMISEAASSNKYVVVFKSPGLSKRHLKFLASLALGKYIYLVDVSEIGDTVFRLLSNKPKIEVLDDNLLVRQALKRIL